MTLAQAVDQALLFRWAKELGWDDMGITEAKIPPQDLLDYETWLNKGFQADLSYMENRIRKEPEAILSGAKSAILFISHYKQPSVEAKEGEALIASYAHGRDYHNIHRKRLKKFIARLEEHVGEKGIARGFSDSAPVLEKALAVRAGLGWFGKNTLLIHRRFGTELLLSGLFTTLEIPTEKSSLRLPRCGSCRRCMDACPTNALVEPYQLDAARCLSYHTIESKKPIPEEIARKNPGYLFGCDLCQLACPHNWKKTPTPTEDFSPKKGLGPTLGRNEIQELCAHPQRLHGTPLQRKGARGLQETYRSLFAE